VYELGEIAAQGGSESEQIIEQLQQLTQDNDPDVRLQAVMALTKVQQ
jgi:HEAT repeat protein